MATHWGVRLGRYGVTVVAAGFAVGALIEDLVTPTVVIAGRVYDRGPEAVLTVVLAAATTLVALRRRLGVVAPLSALVLFGLASFTATAWLLDSVFVYLLVMLTCGLSGYFAHSRTGYAGLLVVLATGSLAVWRSPEASWGKWLSVVAFMVIAWGVGQLIRGPVVRAKTAEERATQFEQERAEAARQAVIDERQRIARELHDIIAHSVSVMTVQAGGVRRRLTPDQTRERESLVAVERTGREALNEMRRLVGLLNEDEGNPSYAPQPGMRSLDLLLDTMREAGLPVTLTTEGRSRELPPAVDLTAYRVVQEALTNTLKHAGPAQATVRICWGVDELVLEVTNNGRYDGASTGYGNAGMRERLRLYHGRLEAGPGKEGGYALRAYLPIGPVT